MAVLAVKIIVALCPLEYHEDYDNLEKCLNKQCRPRSDCSSRSSLIRVYTVRNLAISFTNTYLSFRMGESMAEINRGN